MVRLILLLVPGSVRKRKIALAALVGGAVALALRGARRAAHHAAARGKSGLRTLSMALPMLSRWHLLALAFAALLAPAAAWAGPPFMTDDPEPTETGHWEIYGPLVESEGRGFDFSAMEYLPAMLLSGFLFPFVGMPRWAQSSMKCAPFCALSENRIPLLAMMPTG